MSHTQRVPLRPMIVPGPIWRRHRHFLVPDLPVDGSRPFRVLDATTGRSYPWKIWPPGSTTIGVPTRWACLRRGWTGHRYYLVVAPEGRSDGMSTVGEPGMLGRVLAWLRSRVV